METQESTGNAQRGIRPLSMLGTMNDLLRIPQPITGRGLRGHGQLINGRLQKELCIGRCVKQAVRIFRLEWEASEADPKAPPLGRMKRR